MNTLKTLLTFAFILLSLSGLMAQNTKGIHSITIFEFEGNGIVKIDHNGDTSFGEKVDLKNLNKKIGQFLITDGYKKSEPNNNPPPSVSKPGAGNKNTYITVITESDYIKDKDFANKTTFMKEYKNVGQAFNQYEILDLFSDADREKIMKNLQEK